MFYKTASFVFGLRHPRNLRILRIRIINTLFFIPLKCGRAFLRIAFKQSKKIAPLPLKKAVARMCENVPVPNNSPRMYLKSHLKIEDLFKELNQRNIRCVVMRWFEDLPYPKKNEDIDLLVDENDLPRLKEYFTPFNNGQQAFDIYSHTGIKGHDFKSMPYFPPQLAQNILQNRVFDRDLYPVPNARDYFLSMAYHAIFHKAEKSGLVFDSAALENHRPCAQSAQAEHDYQAILESLARESGISIEQVDFISLYDVLEKHEWLPSLDTLRFIARDNRWVRAKISSPPAQPESVNKDGQIIVFIVREWAVEHNQLEIIQELIKEKFLDILLVHEFSKSEQAKAATYIRGGKWDRGPYPVSGGKPAAIIVAYDYSPERPDKNTLSLYPYLDNKHILIKHEIRDYLNEELLLIHRTNCMHSADCEGEAWDYIDQTIPQYRAHIEKEKNKRVAAFQPRHPIVQTFKANGTRAKTEKIDFNGELAVKKTFRIGCEEFAAREAFAYETFSSKSPHILPLLDKEENYIILPWIENKLAGLSQSELKQALRPHGLDILKTMKMFYEHGYAIIGFYPGNLLLDEHENLYVIDFEFLYKYKQKPLSFWDSYDLAGVPAGFEGDLPRGHRRRGHTYANTWRHILGPISNYRDAL